VALNNSGMVEVVEGTLRLDGGGTLDGTIDIQAAGVLMLQAGAFVVPASASLGGDGGLAFGGGSARFENQLSLRGLVSISGGTWDFAADQVFDGLSMSGGNLRGAGRVTFTNSFSWTGGTMLDAGTTALAPGASGSIPGSPGTDLAAARRPEKRWRRWE
ncbi:MAG TPA: hypothetical protein DCY13_14005, partial [Verrucomicrobiales bacterium]|nr:hypothetical protein [Verrucomicrobiales bacterium]